MKLCCLLLILQVILHLGFPATGQHRSAFSAEEIRLIRKANTARFAFYHNRQGREFIRLMNLARMDTDLTAAWLKHRHGIDSAESRKPLYGRNLKFTVANQSRRSMLRPSLGLHLSAWIHAVFSGLSGTTGHQNLDLRVAMFLNLNAIPGGVGYGENCEYANKKASLIFLSLMNSPPHRENILDPLYMRCGVSTKYHRTCGKNTVTVFSGAKPLDMAFRRKEYHLTQGHYTRIYGSRGQLIGSQTPAW